VAGKRQGKGDDRWLWPEMVDVINRVKPDWVLAENVPGIIRMELDQCLVDLEDIGYAAQAIIVPACAVDAPHRRSRVWIVANANSICSEWRADQQIWEQKAGIIAYGTCENVADAGCELGEEIWPESQKNQPQKTIHDKRCRPFMVDAADADAGCAQQRRTIAAQPQYDSAECGSRWKPEPELGRVAHGIPHRVDRLRGLGNAIVPQVAYVLIRMMISVEKCDKENK